MTYSVLIKSETGSMRIVSRSVELSLRAIGIWPDTSYAYLRRLSYIFVIALFPTFQYQYLISHFDDDISSLMDVFSTALTYSVWFVKLIILTLKAGQVYDIFARMADDWKGRDVSDKYAMTRIVHTSGLLSNFLIVSFSVGGFIYTTGAFIRNRSDNQTAHRDLLLKMELPFEINSTSVYIVTLVIQYVHMVSTAGMFGVMDSLLLTLVLHVCGQIDIVRQRLSEITLKNIDEDATTEIMKRLIVRHQNIISFSQNIEAVYSSIALIQFVSNTMVICCLGFLIVISLDMPNGSTMLIKSLLFYINMSVETFIFCFAGEYLSTKSKLIGDAVYESLWYHLKPKQSRDLLFMIVRSQKQLKLTVGKFVDLSLTQFANVVKASASYVSVLHAMY